MFEKLLSSIDTTLGHNIANEVCQQVHTQPNSWFDWVSLIASIVTLVCFIMTCYQLWKLKKINKEIEDAVAENGRSIQGALTLITITDALRLSDMVITLIRGESYGLAAMKLHDLNNAAIEICQTYQKLKVFQLKLPSEIDHLSDMSKGANSIYKASLVLSTLQQFNDALKEIEASVKIQTIKRNKNE